MVAAAAALVASSAASGSPAVPSAKDDSQAQALHRERDRKRRQLRAANVGVWSAGPAPPAQSLDSNLKKNTAYVKRAKQSIGHDARDQLLKDLPQLNLEKYLQELIQAVSEALTRCVTAKDCIAATEIISAFHARFGPTTFSEPLTTSLEHALAPPSKTLYQSATAEQKERDEAARVARQKPLLRVTAELALVDALGHTRDAPTGSDWLFSIIKALLATDKDHANVPLLISLLKGLGQSLLSPAASFTKDDDSLLADRASGALTIGDAVDMPAIAALDPASAPLVTPDMQAKFRKLFETYFQTLARRVVKEHQRLQDQDRKNHEAYIRSGEIFEDRQQNYERMTKSFERVREWARILSDLLGVDMPDLESSASATTAVGLGVNLESKSAFERADEEFASDQSPWEDQDSQKFYEDLLDLGDIIPPSILAQTTGISAASSANPDKHDAGEDGANRAEEEKASTAASTPQLDADAGDEAMNAGPAAQLATLMAKLPDMTNRSMIDSAAVDFAFIATKPARRKLVKHLASLPRNRIDLAPYYARLAATLSRYMPDIGAGLTALLEDEFRYLQRKKNADLTETRAKNARFISELTKFKVTPTHAILHCFKTCLEDFSGPNIEVVATLLEGCGRYLLRTEDTSVKMRSMLEMLRRKRAAANLDSRQLLLLNNAYYQCNPPKRKAIEQKSRSPMELYIRHLIYHLLAKKSVDTVVLQLRKLAWDDAIVHGWLKDAFTRAWRIRYSNIHLLAILVYDLDRFHPSFAVDVIDQVLENIRIGMEENIFKHNQRRVATACYLGELYNYRLVNSGIVFEQLWSMVTFGHAKGRPWPGQVAPLDAPDDYFRIRLICTLLDTCGVCFDRGSLRRKLDDFLVFLNFYVLCKQQPLPIDVDFTLTETLEALRPELRFKKTFGEAAAALEEMMAANRQLAPQAEAEAEEESDGNSSDTRRQGSRADAREASATRGSEKRRRNQARNQAASDASDSDNSSDSGSSSSSGSDSSESASSSSSGDSDASDSDASDSGSSDVDDSDDDEAAAERHLQDQELAARREADDEFDRELARMMVESSAPSAATAQSSVGASTSQRPHAFFSRAALASSGAGYGHAHSHAHAHTHASGSSLSEIGLPIKKKAAEQADGGVEAEAGSHMKFSLLSKKGSKQVTHEVHVPATASIAINTRTKQLKEEAERRQLKQQILAYERSSESQQHSGIQSQGVLRRQQPQPQHHHREEPANRAASKGDDFKIWTSHGF